MECHLIYFKQSIATSVCHEIQGCERRLAALPFEYPKFVAIAQVGENSFPARLERALMRQMKMIEARPIEEGQKSQVIEGTPSQMIEPPPKNVTDPSLPFTTLRRRV
jgi:hypothetical protein